MLNLKMYFKNCLQVFLFFVFSLFSVTSFSLDKFKVENYGIVPSGNPLENTIKLNQLLSSISSKGGEIQFPETTIPFGFDANTLCILIAPTSSVKIVFKGKGWNSKLQMSNENPSKAFDLFRIKTNYEKCEIQFENLQMIGSSNPGNQKEKNARTHAIYLVGGNVELNVLNCKVSGNFFDGIVGTGEGEQFISVSHSEVENFGGIGIGLFGTGHKKTLHCDYVKMLGSGLAPNETFRGKDYGASMYCHPNVNVKITNCEFYKNYRNAFQFASGTAIKKKKYNPLENDEPKYQIFENNYFDSTCADGIQLGFYYPFAQIRSNRFYNNMIGVQGLVGATIDENYFDKKVSKAIEFNLDYKANDDDTVTIFVRGNKFFSNSGLIVRNCLKERKRYLVYSSENFYRSRGTSVNIGSAYCGDSSKISFISRKDTFGNVLINFRNEAFFNNIVVIGNRHFIVLPKEAKGSVIKVDTLQILNTNGYTTTIYGVNPRYNDSSQDVELKNVWVNSIEKTGWCQLMEGVHVKVEARNAKSKKALQANEILEGVTTNFNEYEVIGSDAIATINLFDYEKINTNFSWHRYFSGSIYLVAKDGFKLSSKGNILIEGLMSVPKGKKVKLTWNRTMKMWEVFGILNIQ